MGGFLIGNIPGITRFRIDNSELVNFIEHFDEKIQTQAFRNMFLDNQLADAGFVNINDCLDVDLTTKKTLLGDFRVFSLRIDRRSIPSSTLKIRILEETKKKLQEIGQSRLYREQKTAIKDAVTGQLLKSIPPVTAIYDVVINTVSGIAYVSSVTEKIVLEFMEIYKKAFGIILRPYDAVSMDFINNAGLSPSTVGRDFLTWLWFKSRQNDGYLLNGGNTYTVDFDRRIALESGEGGNAETVVCSGINFDSREAKEALRQGKKIKAARIKIGKAESVWRFTFNGDAMYFQSTKLPESASIEENETPEGRNLERICMMQALTEIMDEFFLMFLRTRTSPEWPSEHSAMMAWIVEMS